MAYYILKSYKLKFSSLEAFESLKGRENCFFFDSSLNSDYSLGRYSYLGIDPFFIFKTKGIDSFREIGSLMDSFKINAPRNGIPFLGGAVGYLAYDLGLILEKKIKLSEKENLGLPDCFFGFYNTIIIFDHFKKLFYIFAAGFPEKGNHLSKKLAQENFRKAGRLISGVKRIKGCGKKTQVKPSPERFYSNFSKSGYVSAVKKALEYIRAGDIYQVNLSQAFEAKVSRSACDIYRRLRKISPSYFSAYLDCGDFQILSSSPERFLRLDGDIVSTRPMKGTRPRGNSPGEDRSLKQRLLESTKDKAELMMIVDLERNDLGRVCNYNSIKVDSLRQLEEYSTVFQTTAAIRGKLHKDKNRLDLLRACFPGGSITGCPKIRSMEIIEQLEPTRRSIYTGSLGYLSFSGNMDFNILIRTILKKDNRAYFSVGGGIVADSVPEEEYRETLVKAKAMMEAIGYGRNSFLKR